MMWEPSDHRNRDLPFAALAVAGVAELGERAAAAFQVAQTE
jgi:hypothetical protein